MTLSSISATFNLLPCLGVWTNSNRLPKHLGLRGQIGFVERVGVLGAQILHDQGDFSSVGIARGDVGEKARPVDLGLAFGHLGQALGGQRFGGHEDLHNTVWPHSALDYSPRRRGPISLMGNRCHNPRL